MVKLIKKKEKTHRWLKMAHANTDANTATLRSVAKGNNALIEELAKVLQFANTHQFRIHVENVYSEYLDFDFISDEIEIQVIMTMTIYPGCTKYKYEASFGDHYAENDSLEKAYSDLLSLIKFKDLNFYYTTETSLSDVPRVSFQIEAMMPFLEKYREATVIVGASGRNHYKSYNATVRYKGLEIQLVPNTTTFKVDRFMKRQSDVRGRIESQTFGTIQQVIDLLKPVRKV
ncbi:MAG: hypothetical protein ACRCXZ_01935 [Patescibacteria group bacterium]